MGKHLGVLLLAVGFAAGVYLVVVNRHSAQLREDARAAAQWKPNPDGRQAPSAADLAKLSARAQWMIDSSCNNEGGNPFAKRNCYAEAASWMLQEAKDQASASDMAYLELVVVGALGLLTLFVIRKKPAVEG